jgi:hypothetical protein
VTEIVGVGDGECDGEGAGGDDCEGVAVAVSIAARRAQQASRLTRAHVDKGITSGTHRVQTNTGKCAVTFVHRVVQERVQRHRNGLSVALGQQQPLLPAEQPLPSQLLSELLPERPQSTQRLVRDVLIQRDVASQQPSDGCTYT